MAKEAGWITFDGEAKEEWKWGKKEGKKGRLLGDRKRDQSIASLCVFVCVCQRVRVCIHKG